MEVLARDARHCANPGCPELSKQEFVHYLAAQRTLAYCSEVCKSAHRELLGRHLGEEQGK